MAKSKSKSKSQNRIFAMDEIRGLCILCMVVFHGFYTAGFIFNAQWAQWLFGFFAPAEPFFAAAFIIICGISSQLSHSNFKRGVSLLIIAIIISLVTYYVFPEQFIAFGIIHFLAVSILLFCLLKFLVNITPTILGIIICVLLYIVTANVAQGYIGVEGLYTIALPQQMYSTDYFAFFGVYSSGFTSSDYFPLLPWFFVYLVGTFLGKYARDGKFPKFMSKKRVPFFAACGRKTLVIYILHQPIIYGICWVVDWVI
ncbi:MAG: DUF1624 domain-containing protein [Oscillospiraceae bacterium]|jgi:uncharacterized membrane protein|nr:DUF1624 domain-containing protein [Oscillospiraceae bacterium]